MEELEYREVNISVRKGFLTVKSGLSEDFWFATPDWIKDPLMMGKLKDKYYITVQVGHHNTGHADFGEIKTLHIPIDHIVEKILAEKEKE